MTTHQKLYAFIALYEDGDVLDVLISPRLADLQYPMVELLVDAGRDRANIGVVDDKFIKKVNKWAGKIKAGEEMAFDAYEDLETYLKGIPHYDPTHLILVGEEEEESEPERA